MRITKSRNKHRQIAYTAELSEYDAEPPSRDWLIDELPVQINPELEAVALYLVFGKWCGGDFTVPQKMGPNTAAAISRHAAMDFFPAPLEFYPKPIFRGTRTVHVSTSLEDATSHELVSLAGSEWNGSLKSTRAMVISSNSSAFDEDGSETLAHLAPALLLAEQLDLAEVVFDVPARQCESLSFLLRQVGVSLRGSARAEYK